MTQEAVMGRFLPKGKTPLLSSPSERKTVKSLL